MPILTPSYDNKIARKYSSRTLEHKLENKLALQEELQWIAEPKQPILCLPTGMTEALGGALFEELLEGILELSAGLVVRGVGSTKYGQILTDLSKRASFRVKILPDSEVSMRKMLAGSDIALFCSAPGESEELKSALRYGVIPISLSSPLLENYNPVQESGNAFVYDDPNKWQCFMSLVRALETFKFPYDWRTIQRHAMDTVGEGQPD